MKMRRRRRRMVTMRAAGQAIFGKLDEVKTRKNLDLLGVLMRLCF